MHNFRARLEIIGVNPFVFVPEDILGAIFEEAGRNKGPIPVRGSVNGKTYTQTLVRYLGEWRLYINTSMLKDSPKHVGEEVTIAISYDPTDRRLPMPKTLHAALQKNPKASKVFARLTPSLQQEIIRYITKLKSEAKIQANVTRAIDFLEGKARFIGREKP